MEISNNTTNITADGYKTVIHFDDLVNYGSAAPTYLVKKEGFEDIQVGDTAKVTSMIEYGKYLSFYPVDIKGTVLVEYSKIKALNDRISKLEEDNLKMKKMLGDRTDRLYSKKEKQMQHIYILADALNGKSNTDIQKSRGKNYSRSAISRVIAVNVRPEMTPNEYKARREQDLARLRKVYDRDTTHTILFMSFDAIEEWYDERAKAKLKHPHNLSSQVE